jgi:hypothetical protein
MKKPIDFNKPVKVISILIIIFLTAYMISVFSSMHAHILPDGKLVVHSHPHGNNHSDNSQKSNHSHTNKEYLIYGLYSAVLNNLIIGIAIPAFVINTVVFIYNFRRFITLVDSIFLCYSTRSPPYLNFR